jgi:hypothetical protein
MQPQVGDFVRVRDRRWLVEATNDIGQGLQTVTLAGIEDDALGEQADVVWDAELDSEILSQDDWPSLLSKVPEDPGTFSAYLRTITWNTASAADQRLLQAPFRAGIRLDAYQLLPLRKALQLPRVNLLIADDVGLGKTVEAGLVLREMLLRRRVDFTLVASPAGMVRQWQDELEAKFGLAFTIVDRDFLSDLRREHGFGINPWETGSRFIISHDLLSDETYMVGLRDLLGDFRPKAMLILDEAHHVAPSHGARYAVDSQRTRAVRAMASRFEHRLFLTATPHNGHSNSFSALLEMLDPQRFTRGVPVKPRELDAVMVRRLKSDLRAFGETFPQRVIQEITIRDLPADAPELALARMLDMYGDALRSKAAQEGRQRLVQTRMVFSGLQKRLLSSIEAFARTLTAHRNSLLKPGKARHLDLTDFLRPPGSDDEDAIEADDAELTRMATDAALEGLADRSILLRQVDAMLALAEANRMRPDARVAWLVRWVRTNMLAGGTWNDRRLIIFTEWEATRLWLERRLHEALHDVDTDHRIQHLTGATSLDEREALKRAFNADPATEPMRILICTDAAREGINLQGRCFDLVHFDLPWNPARIEQRNGRIDRKLQPAPQVFCRYFRYAQRPGDIVLEALIRKTELISTQLGSAGQVLAVRIADDLDRTGIITADAVTQAQAIDDTTDTEAAAVAREEMDDETERRRTREARNIDELRRLLEDSRRRVGVETTELQRIARVSFTRLGTKLTAQPAPELERTELFTLDPQDPAFATGTWAEALDDLRVRRRKRNEPLRDYRATAPLRRLSFAPAILPNGADAPDVVQLHLEHRLIRRLLARFTSQGFQGRLSRCCVVAGPGAQPRVVVLGRLALYGPGAARLHEEILPVTAIWQEATHGRSNAPLRPLGIRGEDTTLAQLEAALSDPRRVNETTRARLALAAPDDAKSLVSELQQRADARRIEVEKDLTARGEAEARSLRQLLEDQRGRIAKQAAEPENAQPSLPGIIDNERAQYRADRRHWAVRLTALDAEIQTEPDRIRDAYRVRAARLEPVGLVYLWPATN